MKKIKKIFILIPLVLPLSTLIYSCSSTNIQNKQEINNGQITNNLTKEQIKFIDRNNVNLLISKFNELLINKVLDLTIFPNLEIIEKEAFVQKNIEYIKFNQKIKIIKENAFLNIKSLKELKIPSSLEIIEGNSFNNAFAKNSLINFNNSLIKDIGENAFSNNTNLTILASNENIRQLILKSKFNGNILENSNNIGGSFSGLQVNKYLSIISNLSLNKKTILSSLTDELLTNDLNQKIPNKNYLVKILNGSSESKGILKLKLIENTKIINDDIEIKGFEKIENDNYTISKINIDSSKWFIDKQLDENINNWTNEDWLKYLSTLEIESDKNIKYNLINLKDNLKIEFIYDKDNKKLKIKLSTNYKEYKNNNWSIELNQEINNKIITKNGFGYEIKTPSNEELFNFIKNNLKIIEQNKDMYISKRYSSHYLYEINGLSIKNGLNQLLEISNEYKEYIKTYLKVNDGILSLEFQDVFPDDINGILNLNYKLVSHGKTSASKTHLIESYSISGFKKQSSDINFQISVLKNKKRFESLKKQINSKIKKSELKNMIDGDSKEIDNFGFYPTQEPSIETIRLLVDDNSVNENTKRNYIKDILENFSVILNNIDLDQDSFFYKTNYFYNTPNQTKNNIGFIIKSLYLSTNKKNKAKIEKTGNIWTYSFPLNVKMEIMNSKNFSIISSIDLEKEIKCTMTLLSNDINNLN